MLEELKVKIVGIAPLLMHNGQTADPLNSFARELKAVSSKRKKSEDDYQEMARIEWHAGLYVDDDGYPCIPDTCIEAAIIDGAKKSKLGKHFKSSVFCEGNFRVDYGGRKKAVDLWGDDNYRDTRSVRVGQARVMRTRPIFRNWSAVITVMYDAELTDEANVLKALDDAGRQSGVGDFRPKFGRFEVQAA